MTEELSQETVGREATEVAGGMASAETKMLRGDASLSARMVGWLHPSGFGKWSAGLLTAPSLEHLGQAITSEAVRVSDQMVIFNWITSRDLIPRLNLCSTHFPKHSIQDRG